ncbi:MAG: EAL domain-containing protein [Propionibacteriales bacterium]|nr:EAL domain-containing protein [Propionibacteriales bacterium]
MAWWQLAAFTNGIIGLAYLAITWTILKGLRDTEQMRYNRLALATAGIFFTCAVHHGSHTLHMLLPFVGWGEAEGRDMRQAFDSSMVLWDVVGAMTATYYLTLRRSYDRLLTSPQMFEDRVREEAAELLKTQAYTDTLTALPNRAAFNERLRDLAAQGATPSLVFLDLDRFKIVNDTLGHSVGDELLVTTAARLGGAIGEEDEIFRLGGDEFTVICRRGRATATETADRMLAALIEPFFVGGKELYSGASFGVAHCDEAADLHQLTTWADTAMYHAKGSGRNVISVFDPSMSDKGLRLTLANDLTRALKNGELRLEFQPILSLATGRIEGAEALLRWDHPARGPIAPEDFIPFAEETGQIVPVGRWVLREACRLAVQWSSVSDGPFIAINVSSVEIERSDFVAEVVAGLAESGLPAQRLWLELTERAGGGDTTVLHDRLTELAALGVRAALDDFGTGWSSLTHLNRLPIKMIKVDREMTTGTPGSKADAIAGSVVRLGRELNLTTVAEGIETWEQLERMRELGCDLGQGFFFGHPASPEGFLQFGAAAAGP